MDSNFSGSYGRILSVVGLKADRWSVEKHLWAREIDRNCREDHNIGLEIPAFVVCAPKETTLDFVVRFIESTYEGRPTQEIPGIWTELPLYGGDCCTHYPASHRCKLYVKKSKPAERVDHGCPQESGQASQSG